MGCGSVSKDTTKTRHIHSSNQANFDEVPPKVQNSTQRHREQIDKKEGEQKQAIKFEIEFDEEAIKQQKLKKLYLMQKKKKQEQAQLEQKKQQILQERDRNQENNQIKVHAQKRLPPLKKVQQRKTGTAITNIENSQKDDQLINNQK